MKVRLLSLPVAALAIVLTIGTALVTETSAETLIGADNLTVEDAAGTPDGLTSLTNQTRTIISVTLETETTLTTGTTTTDTGGGGGLLYLNDTTPMGSITTDSGGTG